MKLYIPSLNCVKLMLIFGWFSLKFSTAVDKKYAALLSLNLALSKTATMSRVMILFLSIFKHFQSCEYTSSFSMITVPC